MVSGEMENCLLGNKSTHMVTEVLEVFSVCIEKSSLCFILQDHGVLSPVGASILMLSKVRRATADNLDSCK